MDDYLIGIRLALDNGVSAGLASIRADLVTLDRAVSNSAEGLRALSTMAPSPQPPAKATPTQQVGRISEAPSAASAAPPPTPPDPAPRAAPIIRIHPATSPQPIGWVSAAPPITSAPPPTAVAVAPTATPSLSASSPGHTHPAQSFVNRPLTPTAPGPARPIASPSPSAPQAALAASNGSEPSLAPIASPSQSVAQPTAYAPPSHPQPSQPTGGDVFLDGERVGHWLANHLAREANRPSAGGTGFDPNLGITWPGAAQGGQ